MGPQSAVTLLGIIETDAYHMWYAFHPQGKNWSHADFMGIAEALMASETGSKTKLKTTLAKHSSDHIDNCDARGLPHDFQPLNALPQYAGKKKTRDTCFEKVLKLFITCKLLLHCML